MDCTIEAKGVVPMTLAKRVTVFDIYDRAKTGEKMEESVWDYQVIPQTASKLKKKYNLY